MKTRLRNLRLLIVSSCIALLLVEFLVRLCVPQQLIIMRPDMWRPDSTFGHRHQENVNTVVNAGEGKVHFVTDTNGYRVTAIASNETEHDFNILVLGDSFLEAIQVENEFAIPELIRKKLESKYGICVHIDNTAVEGWNPNHYFLEAKGALARSNYGLGLVFLFVDNDVIQAEVDSFPPRRFSERHKIRVPQSLDWSEMIDAVFYPINDFFEARSHFFILAKKAMRVPLAKLGLTAYYFPTVFYRRERNSSQWQTTASVCGKIKKLFDRYETPVLFILIPARYQVHDEIFFEYIESFNINPDSVDLFQPNEFLKIELERRKMTVLDPLGFMRRRAENGEKMYGKVDSHFNENGHRAVSEYIFPSIDSASVQLNINLRLKR